MNRNIQTPEMRERNTAVYNALKKAVNQAGYDFDLLSSNTRVRRVSDLRAVVFSFLYENSWLSYADIAKLFNKQKSDIPYMIKKGKRLEKDPEYSYMRDIIGACVDEKALF